MNRYHIAASAVLITGLTAVAVMAYQPAKPTTKVATKTTKTTAPSITSTPANDAKPAPAPTPKPTGPVVRKITAVKPAQTVVPTPPVAAPQPAVAIPTPQTTDTSTQDSSDPKEDLSDCQPNSEQDIQCWNLIITENADGGFDYYCETQQIDENTGDPITSTTFKTHADTIDLTIDCTEPQPTE